LLRLLFPWWYLVGYPSEYNDKIILTQRGEKGVRRGPKTGWRQDDFKKNSNYIDIYIYRVDFAVIILTPINMKSIHWMPELVVDEPNLSRAQPAHAGPSSQTDWQTKWIYIYDLHSRFCSDHFNPYKYKIVLRIWTMTITHPDVKI
jgi:hypothetical protein